MSLIGRSRPAASRTRRWSPASGASPPMCRSRTSCTCASCARRSRMGGSRESTLEAALAAAGCASRSGPRADVADIAADRFPATRSRGAGALPPAGAGAGPRALCRRARRGRVRHRRLSRRRRRRSGRTRDRGAAGRARCRRGAGRVRAGRHRPKPPSSARATAMSMRRFADAHASRRARSGGRPAFRRAAGDARRDRPLRRGARRSGAARRRQGAAPQPRRSSRACSGAAVAACICTKAMSAAASASAASSIPKTCWSASRRCARPPGQMDRGPARASDRRQPFAPAAPPHPRRGRRARAASSRSTTSSSTIRAPMSAPTAPRVRRYRRRHAARPLSRAGLSRGGAFPADQQDAGRHLSRARPLREHLRARAPDRRHRATARHFDRSRCAGAISSPRARCRYARPSRRSAREWCIDSGDYRELLDKALARIGWDALQAELARAPRRGRTGRRRARVCSSRRAASARSTARRSRSIPPARSRWSPAPPRSGRASRP